MNGGRMKTFQAETTDGPKEYPITMIDAELVPEIMFIGCKKKKGLMRQMRKCFTDQQADGSAGCEWCLGVIEVNAPRIHPVSKEIETPPFPVRYRVVCGYPKALQIIEGAED